MSDCILSELQFGIRDSLGFHLAVGCLGPFCIFHLLAAGFLPHRVTRGHAGSYSLQRVTEPELFPHSTTPSDGAASPVTRRAVACHCPQSPSKLTSLRYKELIVFHALSRLTKHILMMSTQTDSLAPQLRYCFYFAI